MERVIDAGRRFALRLSGAVSSLKTYPADHPSLQFSYRGIGEALTEMVELMGATQITVMADAVSVGDNRAELDPSAHEHMKTLATWLAARDAATMRCDAPVSQEDVQRFIGILIEVGEEGVDPADAREEANRLLAAAGVGQLRLESRLGKRAERKRSADPARSLLEVYLEMVTLTEDLVVHGPRAGTLAALEDTMQVLVDVVQPRPALVPVLLGLGQGIEFESRHVANMTVLALGLGARLGLNREALADLGRAVATMDLGMRVLPLEVRRASRQLHPSEVATLHTHPIETVRAHLNARALDNTVRRRLLVGIEQHLGVRRDGYPAVHRWPALHLFSRIASVCDAYDALTSTTGWRRGLNPAQAIAQLLPPADKSHDSDLVVELAAMLGAIPPACKVRLSDDRVGTVLDADGPEGLPVVRIDGDGSKVAIGQRGPDGALALTIAEVMVPRVGA